MVSQLFFTNLPYNCSDRELKEWIESRGIETRAIRIIRDVAHDAGETRRVGDRFHLVDAQAVAEPFHRSFCSAPFAGIVFSQYVSDLHHDNLLNPTGLQCVHH